MKTSLYYRAGPSPQQRILFTVLAVIVGGAGCFAVLVATGVIDLPFLRRPVLAQPKPRPEGDPIPLSARTIPAYTELERGHVMNEKAELTVLHLPADQVQKHGLLPLEKILGRVLKAEKAPGYGFSERDFLPIGTRPGIVGGVPYGKRSFMIEADRIGGVDGLNIGDHVDVLLGEVILDMDKSLDKILGPEAAMLSALFPGKRYGGRVLAQDSVVVTPVTNQKVPVKEGTLGRDGNPKLHVLQRLTIAVEPKEAPLLTAALAAKGFIYCVGRSGLPDDSPGNTPDTVIPLPKVTKIETIRGSKRDFWYQVHPSKALDALRGPSGPWLADGPEANVSQTKDR
jgi:hypothetical protein